MAERERWPGWFVAGWPRVGVVAAVLILALLPAFWTDAIRPLVLAAALLPAYLLHQYEEHGHGCFVAFFNAVVGKGLPLLTAASACWINVVGVWLLFPVALLLARWVALGYALIPIYLTLVNALTHVAMAVALRRSNPGLVSALLLLLPGGAFVLIELNRQPVVPLGFNALGLAVALLLHAAIVAYALARRASLRMRGSVAAPP